MKTITEAGSIIEDIDEVPKLNAKKSQGTSKPE